MTSQIKKPPMKNTGGIQKEQCNYSAKLALPPFGKILRSRIEYNNPPFLNLVCIGMDSWRSVREWNKKDDYSALTLPSSDSPDRYEWPVKGLNCVIEWNVGPTQEYVVNLVQTLFKAGAPTVIVWPLFSDRSKKLLVYDVSRPVGERIVQTRETVRIYSNPLMEVPYAS